MSTQPAIRRHDSWQHQCAAFAHAQQHNPAALLAMGMGTGKSKVAIDLVANEGHDKTLILCPKSVLGVWRREFERHWPSDVLDLAVLVLDGGTCRDKAERLARFMQHHPSSVKVVVANYDAAWREPLGGALLAAGFRCAIGDELHRIKAPGGKASKWMQRLGLIAPRRFGLTGTPMPHSPLDLYGQFRFLAPQIFGTSYTRFRARYAISNPQFPSQIRQWINQEDLQQRFLSITYQCTADEVLDLPPTIFETRSCPLSAKTRRVYHDLEKEFIAELEAGTVTVSNALAKTLRLRQCTSGFVGGVTDDDEVFTEELGTEKADLLSDLLEDIAEPAVVFCEFRHDLDTVEALAKRLGRTYGELSGRRRDAITENATMADVAIAGVQIASGGVGIDLTRACYGIYFSPTWSLGNFDQSKARLHRPGQTRCVRFYALVAEKTIDEQVYRALERRQEVIDIILYEVQAA